MRQLWLSKKSIFRFAFLLIACAASLLCEGHAQNVFDAISSQVEEVFEKAKPCVVKVRALSGPKPLAGSGFFIDDHGTILTSYAGVRDARNAWIEYEDKKVEAKILGRDPRSGIAILKIDRQNTPSLKVGDSHKLKIASGVVGVAFPYNLPVAPSFGFVTGFDVRYLNFFFATTHFRSSMKVSPGQIGGPVLNSKGEAIGMIAVSVQGGNESYAIPIQAALKIVSDVKKFGEPRHGWVGVGVVEGKPENDGSRPVQISHLFKSTPAESSGIEPGDVLLKIGKSPIMRPSDVLDVAFFAEVGNTVAVQVLRGEKHLSFDLPIEGRPETSRLVEPARILPAPENKLRWDTPNKEALPVSGKTSH